MSEKINCLAHTFNPFPQLASLNPSPWMCSHFNNHSDYTHHINIKHVMSDSKSERSWRNYLKPPASRNDVNYSDFNYFSSL
jgi:hypothetical protein